MCPFCLKDSVPTSIYQPPGQPSRPRLQCHLLYVCFPDPGSQNWHLLSFHGNSSYICLYFKICIMVVMCCLRSPRTEYLPNFQSSILPKRYSKAIVEFWDWIRVLFCRFIIAVIPPISSPSILIWKTWNMQALGIWRANACCQHFRQSSMSLKCCTSKSLLQIQEAATELTPYVLDQVVR